MLASVFGAGGAYNGASLGTGAGCEGGCGCASASALGRASAVTASLRAYKGALGRLRVERSPFTSCRSASAAVCTSAVPRRSEPRL